MNTKTNIPEEKMSATEYNNKPLESQRQPSVETPAPTPEAGFEVAEPGQTENKEGEKFLEQAIDGLTKKLRGSKPKPSKIPQVKDEITLQIEKVMEEGLGDAFKELTPIQKQEFKIKGEETAWEIRNLLRGAHLQVKKIVRLILAWLKMLPGINRFFLEQEAKIKTDKIIALKEINKYR